MLWLIAMAGAIGVLLGLQLFRVHLIVAVSGVLALACIAVASVAQWSLLTGFAFAFALMGALQGGYLGGVLLSGVRARAKAPQPIFRSSHIDQ